jgi:hypothetical protein
MNKRRLLCALGTKPPKRVEGIIAVEYKDLRTEGMHGIKGTLVIADHLFNTAFIA